jgi:hypothetical protein
MRDHIHADVHLHEGGLTDLFTRHAVLYWRARWAGAESRQWAQRIQPLRRDRLRQLPPGYLSLSSWAR